MSTEEVLPFGFTLQVRDACLCLHLQRAARAVARIFDDAFRPLGLTSGQFSLLMALNRPLPPTLGSVAALLSMDRTTLTANLKPLERRGLVRSASDGRDRRARLLSLTPAGRALLAQAAPVWQRVQAALEARLDGTADALRAGLCKLSSPGDQGFIDPMPTVSPAAACPAPVAAPRPMPDSRPP